MHICIINITLLALCHSDMFQPSKAYLQEVRQIHFKSKVNKISYQMLNYGSQIQHVASKVTVNMKM